MSIAHGKRCLSILLAALMIAATVSVCLLSVSAMRRAGTHQADNTESSSGMPARDDSGKCGANLFWTFKAETGELTISGTGSMDDYGNHEWSPWMLSNQDHIKTATISDGVTSIGDNAFSYCINLLRVTLPESVTKIGTGAFEHCWHLASVTIPNRVTAIGDYAFICCSDLTSVTIPESVTSIGESAFESCESLTAFTVSTNNPAYSSGTDGVLYNKDKTVLVQYPNGNSRNAFVIPDSVKVIGSSAFDSCTNLTNVTIPNSVTTIGMGAFFDCENLEDTVIPNSVTTIEASAFYGCSSLTSMMIPFSVTSIGNVAFCDCDRLVFVHIPSSVKHIGSRAFTTSPLNGAISRLPLYICSDTADCYAKLYAKANGIEFRVCSDHVPVVTIRDHASFKAIGYRVTVTFAADVTNAVDGAEIHWFINDQDKGTGETYTVTKTEKPYTVQAKYIKDGFVLAESPAEKIIVKGGFLGRIAAFIRALAEILMTLAERISGQTGK